MLNYLKQLFIKPTKPSESEPVNVVPLLYKDGVRIVCDSLDVLFGEIDQKGFLRPWDLSGTCKSKRDNSDHKASRCNHVVSSLSGIIQIYTKDILHRDLLEPLADFNNKDLTDNNESVLELIEHEQKCLREVFKVWYNSLDLDWLVVEIQTRQFIHAYDKSQCKKMFMTQLSDSDHSFLTEPYLSTINGYGKCIVEYFANGHLLYLNGLIAGFIEEAVKEYKKRINNSNTLQKPLIL